MVKKSSVKAAKRKLHTGRSRNPGNVAKYTTRNKALNRLQLKLPEFRRLCILKGIHPREPKKKFEGHNKTYYHVKDINFLAHEPLLEKSREIRAFERKITKARAKLNDDLAQRLQKNCPTYTLDHLVKERYPSFIDALRDLDDPLTMVHLFATLPADTTHKVPYERVQNCRRLSLEWQAYITRTYSLRKVFVSVKGIYYQAEVSGQKITWLTPHVLSQVMPDDVDFRVMLTFAEFYETLLGFVNFKLYHTLGLSYPPVLDPRLEQVAAELYALMRDLSGKSAPAVRENESEAGEDTPMIVQSSEQAEESKEKRLAESQARLASLQDRLQRMEQERSHEDAPNSDDLHEKEAMDVDEDEDLETRACKLLFKDLKFFLAREVPRESLLFVIRSFGGTVSWDADGAPFPESDEGITHQIVDRPTQGHVFLSRQYVQPQWVYDCANSRLLLPAEPYFLGRIPPPHLSPFVDNEAEGHIPEYADTIKRLQLAASKQLLPLPGSEAQDFSGELAAAAAARRKEDMEAEKERELGAMEKAYAEDLAKELAGKQFSAEQQKRDEEDEEKPEEVKSQVPEGDEEKTMAKMMLSRNKRNLYQAMEIGKEKKKEGVRVIKERKRKADEKKMKAQ